MWWAEDFLIVAVSGHPRRPPELADSASHPGPERQREIPRQTQGKGWGKDQGRQRAAEGGGDPRWGGGGAPRHGKQSGADRRGRGPRVGAGLGETEAVAGASGRRQINAEEKQADGHRPGSGVVT